VEKTVDNGLEGGSAMLAVREATSVAAVTEGAGQRIAERRTRLGLSVRALAQVAGVDRGRLAKIEDGTATNVRAATIGAIERALDELEAQRETPLPEGVRSIGDPADDLYEVALEEGGRRVVVKGRPKDAQERQEIADTAMRLLREAEADVRRAGRGRAVP
jgi:transcriptional regulator with XRE-family HTH domain